MGKSEFLPHFERFLDEAAPAERVDPLWAADPSLQGDRADFLIDQRRIILEIKVLEDDRMKGLAALGREFRKAAPLPEDKPIPLDDVIAAQPDPKAANAQVRRLATISLQRDVIRSANRQLRNTRLQMGLAESLGVVLVINAANSLLQHHLFSDVVWQEMGRLDGRLRRYESIDALIAVSEQEVLGAASGHPGKPLFTVYHHATREGQLAAYAIGKMLEHWAEWIGTTVTNLGRTERHDHIRSIPMQELQPPPICYIGKDPGGPPPAHAGG